LTSERQFWANTSDTKLPTINKAVISFFNLIWVFAPESDL
jgi:hypothetical protein